MDLLYNKLKKRWITDMTWLQNMYAQLLPLALPAPPGMGGGGYGQPPPPMGGMGMGMPPMPPFGMPQMGSY